MAKEKPTAPVKAAKKQWWEDGVRFECQGSGQCCVSRGEYGYVYLNKADRRRMARVMGITISDLLKNHCEKTDGLWRLKDAKGPECIFLKENRCTVYEGRPEQCRTWPFWPEVMKAKTWKKEVASYCPGVGKGRLYTAEEIRATLEQQENWEESLAEL